MILTPTVQTSENNAEVEDTLKQMIGRLGQAEAVAGAVLFLASSDSSFVAGDELCVDSGVIAP
jgi:NAD(P)-dependent dehydrogenase (short-subunit alcohol dehydrogenase family)